MPLTCCAGLSTDPDLGRAVDQVCETGAVGADLACLFVSSGYGAAAERAAAEITRRLGPRALLGCTVQGAIGGGREVESGPSLALWTLSSPDVEVVTFHADATGEDDFDMEALPESRDGDTVLVFPDPFSVPLLDVLDHFEARTTVLGGVASGAPSPGGNRLFRGAEAFSRGAVGAILRGVNVRSVVSQGCRPIGRPFVVTKAKRNLLLGLAGRPPVDRLNEVFTALNASDRALVEQGLHVGCAIDEYKERHDTGDFLIRDVMGLDEASGALAVTDHFRVGQTVQFHVRDGASAREELGRLLRRAADGPRARGALLFSCNGRGTHMFREPHVDASTTQEVLGDLPLAGFFAGGEIGPVGGANFVHGFTASLALFCDGDDS